MDANIRKCGKRSFLSLVKILKYQYLLLRVKTTGLTWRRLLQTVVGAIYLKPHNLTAFVRGLPFTENILGGPRLLYPTPLGTGGCQKLQ